MHSLAGLACQRPDVKNFVSVQILEKRFWDHRHGNRAPERVENLD